MLPKGQGQGRVCDNGLCTRQALITTCRDRVAIFACEADSFDFTTSHRIRSYIFRDSSLVYTLHFCFPTQAVRSLHSFWASARTRRAAFLHQMKYSRDSELVYCASPVHRSVDPGFTTGNCEVRSCGDEVDVFAGAVDGLTGTPWCTLRVFVPCSANDNVYRETTYRVCCTSLASTTAAR